MLVLQLSTRFGDLGPPESLPTASRFSRRTCSAHSLSHYAARTPANRRRGATLGSQPATLCTHHGSPVKGIDTPFFRSRRTITHAPENHPPFCLPPLAGVNPSPWLVPVTTGRPQDYSNVRRPVWARDHFESVFPLQGPLACSNPRLLSVPTMTRRVSEGVCVELPLWDVPCRWVPNIWRAPPHGVTPLGNPPSSNRTLLREGCANDPLPVRAQGSGQPGTKNYTLSTAL